MNANRPSTWAQFYFELHLSAERLRGLMKNTATNGSELPGPTPKAAAEAQSKVIDRLSDITPGPVIIKTGGQHEA